MARRDEYDDERVVIVEQGGSDSGIGMLLLGMALGAGAALLFAPASGKETRERLQREARRAGRRVKDMTEDLTDELGQRVDKTRANFDARVDRARAKFDARVDRARDAVRSRTDAVGDAVDAGREAALQARAELEQAVAESKRAYAESRQAYRDARRQARASSSHDEGREMGHNGAHDVAPEGAGKDRADGTATDD